MIKQITHKEPAWNVFIYFHWIAPVDGDMHMHIVVQVYLN